MRQRPSRYAAGSKCHIRASRRSSRSLAAAEAANTSRIGIVRAPRFEYDASRRHGFVSEMSTLFDGVNPLDKLQDHGRVSSMVKELKNRPRPQNTS